MITSVVILYCLQQDKSFKPMCLFLISITCLERIVNMKKWNNTSSFPTFFV